MKASSSLANSQMEHRWGQRKCCQVRVRVSAGAGVSGIARVRDVSLSGAFLETALALPLFGRIAIALDGDASNPAAQFIASVMRTEPDGVGVEWYEPVTGSICRYLGCGLNCAGAGTRPDATAPCVTTGP